MQVQRVHGVEVWVAVAVLEDAVREGSVGTQMLGDVEVEVIVVVVMMMVRRW